MIRFQPLALAVAVLGAAWMAALASGLWLPPPKPFVGTRLYDFYMLALLDGRFDLPLRELHFEGHFAPDGTGYLYQGIGPVLTRLPFVPFVDLPTPWIGPLSIWFWAVLGNVLYHRVFLIALRHSSLGREGISGPVHTLLAIAIWFGAPGLVLAANGSQFYEPVAMVYALGGGFVLLVVKTAFGELPLDRALVPMALLAGLTLHARPHLAAGFYLATCIALAFAVWRARMTAWRGPVAAIAIMGLFGGALLASNVARFGSAGEMHGSFDKAAQVQYGMVFWGLEGDSSPRTRAFREFGQFNVRRVLPNGAMYLASFPGGAVRDAMDNAFLSLVPVTGYVRVENPNIGTMLLWPLWSLLMIAGLRQRAPWRMPSLAGTVGVLAGAGLLFAYATITLRYHVDLWPAIALPAAFGVAPVAEWLTATERNRRLARGAIVAMLALGVLLTAQTVGRSRQVLIGPQVWTDDFCLAVTAKKGFSPERGRALCQIAEKRT